MCSMNNKKLKKNSLCLVFVKFCRLTVAAERVGEDEEEGRKHSPLRCSAQCWRASPAGPGPTGTAPAQSCRCTGLEEHTARWRREKNNMRSNMSMFGQMYNHVNKSVHKGRVV